MRSPLVLVMAFDDWLANQLRLVAEERRWLIEQVRQLGAIHSEELYQRPSVVVIQVDMNHHPERSAERIRQLMESNLQTSIVVVSDTKVTEDDRPYWTSSWMHLGVSFVLYPPLTRPVLEDLICGLMDANISRCTGN